MVKNKRVKLQIWDTAGQEKFQTITQSYYHNADAAAVVYDVTNRDTFDSASKWYEDVMQLSSPECCKVLIGNKCDLESKRQVTTDEGRELADLLQIPFLETSAMEADNVVEMFQTMAEEMITKSVTTDVCDIVDIQRRNPDGDGCC